MMKNNELITKNLSKEQITQEQNILMQSKLLFEVSQLKQIQKTQKLDEKTDQMIKETENQILKLLEKNQTKNPKPHHTKKDIQWGGSTHPFWIFLMVG